jgi:aspartyl-tRNA(Asn)/glutamyl-tRNA(Gln) amidotransferase subunit B
MEKGEMRCDANVSLRPFGQEAFGRRAEIKNLNSFKGVKDALDYEFARQAEILDSGGRVVQETRLWDAAAMETRSMRSKEEAHDYRYFPDPDLPPLEAKPDKIEGWRRELGELPSARRSRLTAEFQLSSYDAEVLCSSRGLADRFEGELRGRPVSYAKPLANIMMTEFLARLNAENRSVENSPVKEGALGGLVDLIQTGVVSSKGAKEIFAKMWETGRQPAELVSELGLSQVLDEGAVLEWVKKALADNPKAAEDLKGGKDRAIGAIVGAVMKLSKGKANPALVNKLIQETVKQ